MSVRWLPETCSEPPRAWDGDKTNWSLRLNQLLNFCSHFGAIPKGLELWHGHTLSIVNTSDDAKLPIKESSGNGCNRAAVVQAIAAECKGRRVDEGFRRCTR